MVEFKFKSPSLQTEREPLCKRVLSHLQNLPAFRLLCYIDDRVPNGLPGTDSLPETHRAFAGSHVPIIGGGTWPPHVQECFYTCEGEFAFDNLIYIPGTRDATNEAKFVMILAHEFRHFVQYGESKTAWRVHDVLFRNLGNLDQGARVWDIPDERDAMIFSKRVMEDEFGTQAVEQLIETEIADAATNRNPNRQELWAFLGDLSSAAVYNWREETCRIIQRYYSGVHNAINTEEMDLLTTYLQQECKNLC